QRRLDRRGAGEPGAAPARLPGGVAAGVDRRRDDADAARNGLIGSGAPRAGRPPAERAGNRGGCAAIDVALTETGLGAILGDVHPRPRTVIYTGSTTTRVCHHWTSH